MPDDIFSEAKAESEKVAAEIEQEFSSAQEPIPPKPADPLIEASNPKPYSPNPETVPMPQASETAQAPAPRNKMVIDLSHWNHVIPADGKMMIADKNEANHAISRPADGFDLMKQQGVEAVIIKATQGTGYIDDVFLDYAKRAHDAGLLVGAYHFGDASDVDKQAEFFLNECDKVQIPMLKCLDFEDFPHDPSKTMALHQAYDFLLHLMNAGSRPVLYSGNLIKQVLHKDSPPNDVHGQAHGYVQFFAGLRLWIAQYTNAQPTLPFAWKRYFLHQYSDRMPIRGITAAVDVSHYNGTAEQLRAGWL